MPKDDTPIHGTPIPRARPASPPPPLRPVTDSMQPPAGELHQPTTIASDIRALKRRVTARKIAGWITLIGALGGMALGVFTWIHSFAKAAQVERVAAAQAETQRQVDTIAGSQRDHLALHQQEAEQVHELHDDVREIRDLQRAALRQAVYTGQATHARTITLPAPRPDNHPE